MTADAVRRPLLRMQWRHLLFMHWPIAPESLRPLVPDGLAIDTFNGSAWIGLVPFTMRNVLPAMLPPHVPLGDLPALTAFHECNVRTYVSRAGEPGVWFFSLDAASRLAVWSARAFFHLPYFNAKMSLQRTDDRIDYAAQRLDGRGSLRCAWQAGPALPRSQPGELAHFLTERYCLYAASTNGELFRGRIAHQPWPLREAALLHLEDSLLAADGLAIDYSLPPLLHHTDALDVEAWPLEPA